MMFETFVIDDGSPGALALSTNADPYQVTAWSSPLPEQRIVAAEVHEGELLLEDGYRNRELTMTVVVVGATHEDMNDRLAALLERVGKLQREKGRIGWQRTGCEPLWFDVETAATPGVTFDLPHYIAKLGTVELKFTCRPFLRGVERLLGSGTRLAGQRLLTIPDLEVPGDVPALARLEFSGASVPQQTLLYAIDQPDATSLATGVQVACSTLATPGTVTTQVGSLSTNIVKIDAVPTGVPAGVWQPCLSLHTPAGAPIALTGSYRVFARVSCASSGTLQLRLRWSAGRDAVSLSENSWWQSAPLTDWWELADLGTVTIPPDADGLDGVIERVTPYGSDTHLDLLLFIPTDRSGAAYAAPLEIGATIAADSLTGAGSLGGSSAPIGGAWGVSLNPGESGFTRSATGATRTGAGLGATSMLSIGSSAAVRLAVRGSYPSAVFNSYGSYALVVYSFDAWRKAQSLSYTAANVWAIQLLFGFPTAPGDVASGFMGGSALRMYRQANNGALYQQMARLGPAINWRSHRMMLTVDPTTLTASGELWDDSGRSLSTGPVPFAAPPTTTFYAGIADIGARLNPANTWAPLTISDFALQRVQAHDSALYAGRTANISSSGASRQGATAGTKALTLVRDWPLLPPSGRDDRRARVVMGTSRDDMRTSLDSIPTDLFAASVYATPRYLQLPDQAAAGGP